MGREHDLRDAAAKGLPVKRQHRGQIRIEERPHPLFGDSPPAAKAAAERAPPGSATGSRTRRSRVRSSVKASGTYTFRPISLRRRVALKVLSPGFASSSVERQRFLREAQAAARLRHPNIIPVFGFGERGESVYYTMEFAEGMSLDRVIECLRGCGAEGPRRGDLALLSTPRDRPEAAAGAEYPRLVAALFAEVADALQSAHAAGVIHQDIKPANLILDEHHRLLLTDFGLARTREDARLTGTGVFLGTPLYVSPEQSLGRSSSVDHRSARTRATPMR